jgi:hypothetical protein
MLGLTLTGPLHLPTTPEEMGTPAEGVLTPSPDLLLLPACIILFCTCSLASIFAVSTFKCDQQMTVQFTDDAHL